VPKFEKKIFLYYLYFKKKIWGIHIFIWDLHYYYYLKNVFLHGDLEEQRVSTAESEQNRATETKSKCCDVDNS